MEVTDTGIETALKDFVAVIRSDFPSDKIFTERPMQDVPNDYWYLEEAGSTATREQWDSFIELQHYNIYYVPSQKDVGKIQSKLRTMRKWCECNFMWLPFTRDLTIEQVDTTDTLQISFAIWRRFRLDIPRPPKMQTVVIKEV